MFGVLIYRPVRIFISFPWLIILLSFSVALSILFSVSLAKIFSNPVWVIRILTSPADRHELAKTLKNNGTKTKNLIEAGFTLAQLKEAGFTATELKEAGFCDKELEKSRSKVDKSSKSPENSQFPSAMRLC